MLNKLKMSYSKIRQKFDPKIIKSLNKTVRRYKKDELREALSTEEGRAELARKVFFQLPDDIKVVFKDNEDAKEAFYRDVEGRLAKILETPKLFKKVFGSK
tara:strand:- start:1105 stop:1407 length:303 start_codon:yes stop_codon:yes gene_type:complete